MATMSEPVSSHRLETAATTLPWAETVKDSLGACIKAYLIDWPQKDKLDVYELAHIFMFVFGVTFIDLEDPEFRNSLHTNGV
ncbi:hypothetical protein Daesc_007824 [Daldinia eschscholtzii]|uniref:Uncharacterized protein n=1 Tax=Daldinia eschscholtzii TaxID=292717 RepID=A0AAX6MFR4_9PEZI